MWRENILGLCFVLFMWKNFVVLTSVASNPKVQRLLTTNPRGLRLFHPAFPLELIKPVSVADADEFIRIQQAIAPQSEQFYQNEFQRLPWFVFPRVGVPDAQVFLSKVEVQSIFEKTKHLGQLIW